jgi:molybdopterin/thiamine biosynthesis adenylyltransferase
MQDEELLRYARHILLEHVGIEGQQSLLKAHAVIIGAGGLGSPAAMYLASSGVGRITLIDHDTVDLSNLQRQIAHHTGTIGHNKVDSAAAMLQRLNPYVQIVSHACRADDALLNTLLPHAQVVLDCTDNFATRQRINAACVRHRVPLVSAAALQFSGQISVFDVRNGHSPCYACLFPADCPPPETDCATMGVFAPLVGIMGTMQANEALKVLLGKPTLAGKLMLFDALRSEWNTIGIARQHDCAVCNSS